MNSKRIGNIGEAYALAKLVELGIPVYQQFGDNEAADYIILVNNKALKIQVKTSNGFSGDKVTFSLTTSNAHRKNGGRHKYSTNDIDAFICYDSYTKEVFLIKNDGVIANITIRYIKPKNNQKEGINYYTDFLLCAESLSKIA